MEVARRLLLLLLLHHLLPAAPWRWPIQRATTPRLTKPHRRALDPLCCIVPPPPPQPPAAPAYLETPPQPPVPAYLEQPPQPPNAWLPFGELPGTRAVYRFLATPQFELAVCAVVIMSVTVFALETLPMPSLDADMPGLTDMLAEAGRDFEDATTVAFAVEYFARWWSRSLRPSYLLKPLMLIDLASFLPSLLTLVNLDFLAPAIRAPPTRPESGSLRPPPQGEGAAGRARSLATASRFALPTQPVSLPARFPSFACCAFSGSTASSETSRRSRA